MTKEKDQAFYSKLWGLMIPILLQNLMLAMVAVADAFMLGGLDQNYMSALSRNADTVYTKYVSCGGNSQPWDTRSTVLGKRRYYYAG